MTEEETHQILKDYEEHTMFMSCLVHGCDCEAKRAEARRLINKQLKLNEHYKKVLVNLYDILADVEKAMKRLRNE